MAAKHSAFKQWLIVLSVVFLIVLLCVVSTVYVKEGGASVEAMGKRVVQALGANSYSPTMTDAQIACEDATRGNFGKRLRVFNIDSFSSRENLAANIYQMYVNVELYEFDDRKGRAWIYYVRCEVGSDSGDVSVYALVRPESPNAPAMGGESTFDLVL